MAETVYNVYDVAYPSPATLREIASVAIVSDLWREETSSYHDHETCTGCTSRLFVQSFGIPLEDKVPNMPRTVYGLLEKHMTIFSDSVSQWLRYHSINVFSLCKDGRNCILSIFHDFVCDWNGAIDYVRTAKRMMLCDEISDYQKFKIACLYCFEDDIVRIAPSVSSKIRLMESFLKNCPPLYYWICYLRNELHKVPNPSDEASIDEMMLIKCESNSYSCAEFFWNRVPAERQLRAAIDMSTSRCELFARFILPKLNELQLEEFVAKRGVDLICALLTQTVERDLVLPTWMYIRDKIDGNTFIDLITAFLCLETNHFTREERPDCRSPVYLCCVIWNRAARNLKQSVLNVLTSLTIAKYSVRIVCSSDPRETRFIMTVLSDAGITQRSIFWRKYWPWLIASTRVEDVHSMMSLCFLRNETLIVAFKEKEMFKYETLRYYLIPMLARGCVKEVNRLLYFCNSDAQKRLELKQRFLKSEIHVMNSDRCLGSYFLNDDKLVNDFLNDVV